MRAKLMLKLCKNLKQVKISGVPDAELRALMEDVQKFMRKDSEDLEANQQATCMKHLLRGFFIKAWKSRDFIEKNMQLTVQ